MNSEVAGQAAIITGAGRGIGRAIALRLARAGVAVTVASRNRDQLEQLVSELKEERCTALAVPTDVTDPAAVKQLVRCTLTTFHRIDILVNNAASPNYISSLALSDDRRWRQMFDVNVFGVYLCTKAVLPYMIRAKSGRIINISSIAGVTGAAYNSAYAATKAAVIGFTKAVAVEVARLGITSNAICPWHVDTELMREAMSSRAALFGKSGDDYVKEVVDCSPQRRLISVAEVAGLAYFLSLPDAAGITGQILNQSGGAVIA